MSSEPPAKFFVNQGVVSTRDDMLNLLRPLQKQTVTYHYFRGRDLVSHGTGWVERIVVDQPDVSTFFTDRKSTRLNSSHIQKSRMPSSA